MGWAGPSELLSQETEKDNSLLWADPAPSLGWCLAWERVDCIPLDSATPQGGEHVGGEPPYNHTQDSVPNLKYKDISINNAADLKVLGKANYRENLAPNNKSTRVPSLKTEAYFILKNNYVNSPFCPRREQEGSKLWALLKDRLEVRADSPVLQVAGSEQGMNRLPDNGQAPRDLQEQWHSLQLNPFA